MTMRHLRKLAILLFVAWIVSPTIAQPPAKNGVGGKLRFLKVPAPSLKGNLLADPSEQDIAIYLPRGYETSPSKRYPVVYLLHGYGGSPRAWFGDDPFKIAPVLDELIGSGKIREMIIAAPNGTNTLGGSFYVNSAASGNWEDFIVRDVVGYVDSNYRTLARASSRGIVGHSMGGYGATFLGMRNPAVFCALYALSPCCLGLEGEFLQAEKAWKRMGTITSREQLPKEDFWVNAFAALGAAFSPDPTRAPFYSEPLFTEKDGKLIQNEAVAARWKSKMPLYMVADHKNNLLALRGISLDYGQKEEFPHIRSTTARFSQALSENGIPHAFEVYADGDHGSKVTERLEKKVFAFFSEKLDFSNP
jgi:S-formylglutathione hydrolase